MAEQSPHRSEAELQCKLYLARVTRAFYPSEVHAVGDVAVRIQELRDVKDVKELGSELKVFILANRRVLLYGNVEILNAGPAADGAFGRPQSPQFSRGEGVRIEGVTVMVARIETLERRNLIGLAGQFEIETVLKFLIVAGKNTNGEP